MLKRTYKPKQTHIRMPIRQFLRWKQAALHTQVDSVKTLFDNLRNNTKFYFSNSLYLFLLKAAGENTDT